MGDRWRLSRRELAAWTSTVFFILILLLVLRPADLRVETVRLVRSDGVQAQTKSPTRMDLNRASEEELCVLPGVGSQRARQIVLFRSRQGAFRSVDQLADVPGFTRALVDRLAPLLTVSPAVEGPLP